MTPRLVDLALVLLLGAMGAVWFLAAAQARGSTVAVVAVAVPIVAVAGRRRRTALARPRATAFGLDAYDTLEQKAAALLHSLARNHALADGGDPLVPDPPAEGRAGRTLVDRVNGNWRMTFRFVDGDVELVHNQDYH